MVHITKIPIKGPSQLLAGKFWYSSSQKLEHKNMRRKNKMFCIINGTVHEYTYMVDVEGQMDDPSDTCSHVDAEYLGEGFFHHLEPM